MKPSISCLFLFFVQNAVLLEANWQQLHLNYTFTAKDGKVWNTMVWILKHYRPDIAFDVPFTPVGNT